LITLGAYYHMAEHGELAFEPKALAIIKKPKNLRRLFDSNRA
jgi:hypothetical protein